MRRIRIIPTLLLDNGRLVKTVRFKKPIYVGDPINSVKIFNDKQVDELIFLDIAASREGRSPDVALLRDIASECFMPLAYGGGITTIEQAKSIFEAGVEKVVLNSAFFTTPALVGEIAEIYGSQAVVVSIDVKRKALTRKPTAVFRGASRAAGLAPAAAAQSAVAAGAGELMVVAVDRDGTMSGYDIAIVNEVAAAVDVPVIASGGAASFDDFVSVVCDGGASAAAAGAMFVFNGPHQAVLISYPSPKMLKTNVYAKL
jgi:cyclase